MENNIVKNPLMAVVLCGGLSTRMGKDKGLLQVNNANSWAELMVKKLQNIDKFDAIVCSINHDQLGDYQQIFERRILIIDDVDVFGPLKGILSVHKCYPNHHLLIIACDMQNIGEDMIELLLKNDDITCNSIVFQHKNEQFEPLFGLYKCNFLANIFKMHSLGNLSSFSMQFILKISNTCTIKITNDYIDSFKNYNSPDDLL